MQPGEFRRLRVQLPRQPLVNQRPWGIAGLILALVILIIAGWSYYAYRKDLALKERRGKISIKSKDILKRGLGFK